MARATNKTFQGAVRWPFANRFGVVLAQNADHDVDNNKALTWSDAADLNSVPVIALDNDNVAVIDHERKKGARGAQTFYLALNAGLATQTFYIAGRSTTITGIEYTHATAGTDGSAVTAAIFHDTGTQAPGGGTTVQVGTFNCKGTAQVVQNATLLAPDGLGNPAAALTLAIGDRLSIVLTGALTTLAGIVLTVYTAPGFKEQCATFQANANALIASEGFFMANRDMVVTRVNMIFSTAGTDAGAVTYDVTHETSTTAPAGGTTILAATVNAKGTINTVNSPALSATASQLKLLAGDRLSFKLTGTATACAGLVICVYMQASSDVAGTSIPYYGQIDVPFHLKANSSLASQEIYVADRDYEVVDASLIWSTAGTDGGTVTYDYQIDKGTTAAGSGTSISTGAVSAKTTANTTSVLPLSVSRRNRLLSQGDRLSIVLAGTLTSLAGLDGTVSLLPR